MKKSTIAIIVIILIAGGAYFYFEGGSAPSGSATLQSQPNQDAQIVGAQVLALLNQIQSLHIDTDIFKDPAYKTLRDYSVPIPPQPVGRPNPFAPIPGLPTTPAAGAGAH